MDIEQLLSKASTYLGAEDLLNIRAAYELAEQAHEGQMRKSGEPYILHPLAVADIIVEMQLDKTSVMAALLHDVVEDTGVTIETIEKRFGSMCAMLVDGLTKLEKIQFKSKEEQKNENYRKMFVAMAKDLRVILIKLADRLHNMRTIKHQSEEGRIRIAEETLDIYCPIAHRLGMSKMKWEMEDICLRCLQPEAYFEIAAMLKQTRNEREAYINKVIADIRDKLQEMGIQTDITGRPKHIYSTYKKMTTQNKQFADIYDLLAVRIIVENVKDCYAALGIIHTLWRPMPGRFKDYIAMPKPNMYQSLHTTVVGTSGTPFEVQIRTWDMHRTSEFGIAAHWAYKEGNNIAGSSFEEKMAWLREAIETQSETKDASEFIRSLKTDLFSDMVYVFTPRGEVIELPSGSVPIDFAYRIHTEIGNRTIGARVNGRVVQLNYRLSTGDIVEIQTTKHTYGPSQDWLNIAKSSHARSKIRQWFKRSKRAEHVGKGRQALERELKRQAYDFAQVATDDKLLEAARKFNFNEIEDLFVAIAVNGISAQQVATKLTEKLRRQEEIDRYELKPELRELRVAPERKAKNSQGVRVIGVDNLLVRFAGCCKPVPGDDIIGFITRGRGVSVHRANCSNLPAVIGDERERLIDVEWEQEVESTFNVQIEVVGHDRRGLLNDVLQAVSENKTYMSAISGRADKNKTALIQMTIMIRNTEHLNRVMERIHRVKDVHSVSRIMQ